MYMYISYWIYSNDGAAAKLLVDAGANTNARDANGNTPLSLAATLGHYSVVNALLESRDTDINSQVLVPEKTHHTHNTIDHDYFVQCP
jgi:ankyrin repeat protein